jgi:hypothetical protein
MRLIIAGSRALSVRSLVGDPCNPGWSADELDRRLERFLFRRIEHALGEMGIIDAIDEELAGKASGVDDYGERWATARGIPVLPFPPKYDDYDLFRRRQAPLDRNVAMAEHAAANGPGGGALVVITLDRSSGSLHMKGQAEARGLAVWHEDHPRDALWSELARNARYLGMAPTSSSAGNRSLF